MQERTWKQPSLPLLSLLIAIIIYFTAVLGETAVRMYFSDTDWLTKIGLDIFLIFAMAGVVLFVLYTIPAVRAAILHMFGFDQEAKQEEKSKPEPQKKARN
jgi:hypothetical protein